MLKKDSFGLEGVLILKSYTGGITNPTYHDICNGDTEHAEAVRIFDPNIISYEQLVTILQIHNPTTLNRQGQTLELNTDLKYFLFQTTIFGADMLKENLIMKCLETILSQKYLWQKFWILRNITKSTSGKKRA